LTVRDTNPNNEKWVKKGVAPRSLGLLFTFWDPPPNISGMAEDTNLKFCMSTKVMDTKPKNKK